MRRKKEEWERKKEGIKGVWEEFGISNKGNRRKRNKWEKEETGGMKKNEKEVKQ